MRTVRKSEQQLLNKKYSSIRLQSGKQLKCVLWVATNSRVV